MTVSTRRHPEGGSEPTRSPNGGLGEVAIVHDYLNQRGGAERVVLEMAAMWPQAPVYTSLYRPESTFPEFKALDVQTTALDRLPVDVGFRTMFPLYPAAFRSLGRIDADVVISSSSGWAHAVRTSERAMHAVYCYTPARWLYGCEYHGSPVGERLLRPLARAYRSWDRRAARTADVYIAISHEVRDRIRATYRRDAPIVHPPVNVARFAPRDRGDRLLVVSRLLPYKRVDIAVDAATKMGIGLDVVGSGPALEDLRQRAGPLVEFHGRLDDTTVVELFQSCRGFCAPGREDFGIAAVEAQAAGKPVIAFGGGGALETVDDGVSGVLFARQDVASMVDAIRRCEDLHTSPEHLAARANRFSPGAFRRRLTDTLAAAVGAHRRASAPAAVRVAG
jgi:glycosyltransferase involved in cell wall biosynthesis